MGFVVAGSENVHRDTQKTPYKRPLLAAGLTAVAVTAVALECAWWLSLCGVLLFLLWLCYRRMVLCAVVALVYFVVAMGCRHWYAPPASFADGVTDTLCAEVTAEPTFGDMYRVRVTRSAVLRPGSSVMLQWGGEDVPRIGGTVTASVRLYAVKENQRFYTSRGAFVCAFPDGYEDTAFTVTASGRSPSSDGRLRVMRALTAAPRRYLGGEESAILTAMCFGERAFLAEDTVAAFRGSGLGHLLVVSGLHLSMVALAVRRFCRRLGIRWACVLTILAVWLFAWLTGFSPSIVRAAVMCTLWLVGSLLFCRSEGLNSLGLAALLVLIGRPYTLWDAGFQLSFAATLGVLLLVPRLADRYAAVADDRFVCRVQNGVLNGAAVCVAALLFTLPIAAYHYGGFSLTAVISNVLAIPVAGAILLLGWMAAVCGLIPFLGWLSQCLLWVANGLVRYLSWVARICSPDWAWLTVSQHWAWLLLLGVCVAVAVAIGFGVPFRRFATAVVTLVVLAVGVGYPLTVAPLNLTLVPVDNACGVVLRQGGHCALLVTRAGELEEVTYETPAFIPDVVVVGESTAADADQLRHFPSAQVVQTAAMPAGTAVELWTDCRFTIGENGWWRLDAGDTVLWIATDPTAAPPDPDGVCVYVGGTPTYPPDVAYTVVCSGAWLRRHRPVLTGRETFVIEKPMTLIPHRGEWRMSLWL